MDNLTTTQTRRAYDRVQTILSKLNLLNEDFPDLDNGQIGRNIQELASLSNRLYEQIIRRESAKS